MFKRLFALRFTARITAFKETVYFRHNLRIAFPEHFIRSRNTSYTSLCHRCNLWNQYIAGSIDTDILGIVIPITKNDVRFSSANFICEPDERNDGNHRLAVQRLRTRSCINDPVSRTLHEFTILIPYLDEAIRSLVMYPRETK